MGMMLRLIGQRVTTHRVLSKEMANQLFNIRTSPDPDRKKELIKKLEQKLEKSGNNKGVEVIVKDALQRNEWRLETFQREFEPFDEDELVETKFARDELSAEMSRVMVEEETKYYRRVQHARAALDKLKELTPQLVPEPGLHDGSVEFSGPSFSLPVDKYYEMLSPLGIANQYDQMPTLGKNVKTINDE